MFLSIGKCSYSDWCALRVSQLCALALSTVLFGLNSSSLADSRQTTKQSVSQVSESRADVIIPVEYAEPTLGFPQVIQNKFVADEAEPRVAGMISLSKEIQAHKEPKRWSFVEDSDGSQESAFLRRLPPTELPVTNATTSNRATQKEAIAPERLLVLPEMGVESSSEGPAFPSECQVADSTTEDPEQETETPQEDKNFLVVEPTPVVMPKQEDPLSEEEQQLLDIVMKESSSVGTGVVSNTRLNEQAKAKIRSAFALANRRAHFAARQELIEVLRLISQAKDLETGKPDHTHALAAGLRALDEAEDFVPKGTQLEGEMNLRVLTDSHRTPIAKQIDLDEVLPQWVMNKYYRYAQLKLAFAVAGDPAGSMALHTIGKIHSQLCRLEPERHQLAPRRAMAFQQAALFAHQGNHIAAHELGVLLADAGHLMEAEQLLSQVAEREPNSIVFRNLAHVQAKLGYPQHAAANRAQADQLVRRGADRNKPVQWLSPEAFANIGYTNNFHRNTNSTARAPHPVMQNSPQAPHHTHPQFNWR